MQLKCPIQGCGRQFQNQLTMIQHVKRRHPLQSQKIRQKTTNQMLQKQQQITEELNKLPKMQKVIQMSKQKKPIQFQRRSASKKRKQLVGIVQNSQIRMNDIITESRQLIDQNSNSRIVLKKPILSKKSSEELSDTKLPSLAQSKVKKLKLQALKSQFDTTLKSQFNSTLKFQFNNTQLNETQFQKNLSKDNVILQSQSQMYSTAPNIASRMSKKIQSIRSISKSKKQEGATSNRQSLQDLHTIQTNYLIDRKKSTNKYVQSLTKNQKLLQQGKPRRFQRPVAKKLLQRSSLKKYKQKAALFNQPLSESLFIQRFSQPFQRSSQSIQQSSPETSPSSTTNLKVFRIQQRFRKNKQMQTKFTKKLSSSPKQTKPIPSSRQVQGNHINWQQRTLTIRNMQMQCFQIPPDSSVQYLFVHNCQVKELNLGQCFTLTQLSLNNNFVRDFTFLQATFNGAYQNLETLYLDHNRLSSLATLPAYLRLTKLSLIFNQISGLQQTVRILAKFALLEEIDFSFNPLRKQANYKLAILSACKNLKKLDGMVITKFDRQLAVQYHKIYFQCRNILPLNQSPDSSEDKFRPSTAVSINYQQDLEPQNMSSDLTEKQLQEQIQILEKMIKNTKSQYQIIQVENMALQEQIGSYEECLAEKPLKKQQFNPKLYKKICRQVQQLQLLNFLQHASEKQLQELIYKKAKQKGVSMDFLLAN